MQGRFGHSFRNHSGDPGSGSASESDLLPLAFQLQRWGESLFALDSRPSHEGAGVFGDADGTAIGALAVSVAEVPAGFLEQGVQSPYDIRISCGDVPGFPDVLVEVVELAFVPEFPGAGADRSEVGGGVVVEYSETK